LTVFRDQEFTADMMADGLNEAQAKSARAVKRIDDVAALKAAQFPEDAGPMAHPVRPDRYDAIDNFDTATVYEKGAEVVRMLHTLLGEETFRRGCDLYFARWDGRAASVDAFLDCMREASGRDLVQFERWYAQSGTPEVRIEARFDAQARRYTLDIEQHTAATPDQANVSPNSRRPSRARSSTTTSKAVAVRTSTDCCTRTALMESNWVRIGTTGRSR
jgi:aminopeptidase N